MENNEEYNYKPLEPKRLAFDYLFNYFGKDTFRGKVIMGACVRLAIRVYKDEKEVKFTDEPNCKGISLHRIYTVSFDREKLFCVHKNYNAEKLFCTVFLWDKIEYEVDGYTLDYEDPLSEALLNDITDEMSEDEKILFLSFPCASPMEVSEKDFRYFLSSHIDDFDISDNVSAQVPSISYI